MTKFFVFLALGSAFLFVTSFGGNAGVNSFAREYREGVHSMSRVIFCGALVGVVVSLVV